MTVNPEQVARLSADAIWAEDHASRGLGMVLDKVGPGLAVMTMTVTERMVNGLGICHGGFIFALADSTMAFASNSRNQRNVASNCQIVFLAPARIGMTLRAEACEQHAAERTSIYDVTVRSPEGATIAEFRGVCRTIRGAHFDA